ncbi:hypothetical protein ACF0H5_005937 [Mactra antiquata]
MLTVVIWFKLVKIYEKTPRKPLSDYLSGTLLPTKEFILNTEHLLNPKLALQVRITCSSVDSPKEGKGQNKPSDMEKEYQVKELKKLIKGIGANKTERPMV